LTAFRRASSKCSRNKAAEIADLRLSVLLDANGATGYDAMQATTSDGDKGLIVLQTCQAYGKEVSGPK